MSEKTCIPDLNAYFNFHYFSFMKPNKLFFIVLVFLVFVFLPALVKAQYTDDTVVAIKKGDNWKLGYVVLKDESDTLKGYLKINESDFGHVEGVWFRKNKDVKKGTLKIGGNYEPKSTFRFFGFDDKRYKYFNFTDDSIPTERFIERKNSLSGWVEIIADGPINICKGFSVKERNYGVMVPLAGAAAGTMMTGGADNIYIPMYCLKKGKTPTALIAAPAISYFKGSDIMKYLLDDRNKDHLIHYLSDYFLLAQKIKNSRVLFGDIEGFITEYNTWAKENSK